MKRTRTFIREERGAVLVQVGIAVLVLMAFNVFVLDFGMMWIARIQAQNAADAGALAGAVARAYDDRADPPHPADLAGEITRRVARANLIWQQAGEPIVSFDCPVGVDANCTRVDVHRDGSNGSTALPSFFGPILGVNSQQVRATATAVNGSGNMTPCIRPMAFADGWDERPPDDDNFDHYNFASPPVPLAAGSRDDYAAPNSTYPGRTTISGDYGYRIVWDISVWTVIQANQPITRRLMVPLDLPGVFADTMTDCVGQPVRLGQTIPVDTGLHPADATDGINAVFAQDASADYDYGNSRIVNSCAPGCAAVSPRLIPIVLYDPRRFQYGQRTGDWANAQAGCPDARPCVTVSNIVGFFIHRIGSGGGFGPHGHILRYPGAITSTAPTYADDGSWLVTTHLIR